MSDSTIHENAMIAEGAIVKGDITLGKDVNIWYNAVVRADSDSIVIGEGTNIQDNCVLHETAGFPLKIGTYVTVGHGAILHGCTIGDNTLIGMGAIILDGANIGKNCLIGAGALVTQNSVIPDNSLVIGSPAKPKRFLFAEEIEGNHKNALHYIAKAKSGF